MKRKTIIKIVILTVLIILMVAGMQYKIYSEKKVVTYQVKLGEISDAISLDAAYNVSGNLVVRKNNIYAVSLEYNAKLDELYVDDGENVEEGQKLFQVTRLTDRAEITITADVAGTIEFSKDYYSGNIISQYSSILSIYQLSSSDDFYIQAMVPVSVYEKLSNISSAEVTFSNVLSDSKLDGTLEDRELSVQKMNNIDYYNLAIKVDDSESQLDNYKLVKGMDVNVTLCSSQKLENDTQNQDRYYTVPFSAIVFRDEKNAIFTYKQSGDEAHAKMVIVDVISTNGDTAVIRADNGTLSKNDKVITEGNYKLSGNELISVSEGI